MELYILRHGIAEEVSASGADKDRQLTDEGVEKTKAAGKTGSFGMLFCPKIPFVKYAELAGLSSFFATLALDLS